jgi:ABC-type lipoprotein export system ATPase subunit/ABC-type antimicrobial peptide transport system permease subunit
MLEVKNLVKTYKISKSKKSDKVIALNDVSITFPEKGLVFLLGKSGSGKSTLLNAIGGLDVFDSGEIIIKGKSSKDFSQADFDSYRNTFIGFIFQEYNVLEEFTVAKNLGLALELQGKKASKENINALLEQVEMLPFAKRKPNQLSGGQKQRIAIARALIKNPEIIMADEPTGALDSNTGKQVMETLKNLSKEKLVIIVSHDREFAEIYGDRIVELKDGKIINDITKKVVDPETTSSGINIIDGNLIHIRKGIQLTDNDLANINQVLKNKATVGDVIISIDDKANNQIKKANFINSDGKKEKFSPTQTEDVEIKQYNGKDLKLIKSHLGFKDSLKMGASALKSKVGKLIFTILLSFSSFAMFGIVDTLSAFNRPDAVFTAIDMTGEQSVSIKKESKGEYSSNNTQPITDKDISYFQEKFPDISIQPVVNKNLSFGNNHRENSTVLTIKDLSDSSGNPVYNPYCSGMIDITEEKLSNLGFTLLGNSKLPEDNDPDGKIQICISKHLYECFKKNNDDKFVDINDFLSNYNLCNLTDHYNNSNNSNYTFKIVGVIDDHSDLSEFYNIKEDEMENSGMLSGMMLQTKIRDTLGFGYSCMIYTNSTYFNAVAKQKKSNYIEYRYNDNSSMNFDLKQMAPINVIKDDYMNNINPYEYDNFNYPFFIANNNPLITQNHEYKLEDDEVIISFNYLNQILDWSYNYEDAQNLIKNGLTLQVRTSTDSTSPVLKNIKIVGYDDSNYDYRHIISNETLKNILNKHNVYLFYNDNTTPLNNTAITSSNISTIKESFLKYVGEFNPDIKYYKGKDNYTGEISLSENEIIIPYYYFYFNDLDEDKKFEKLKDKISNNFTITMREGYSDESKVFATFKVVGLTNSDHYYISEKYYNDYVKEKIYGYDYAIASLSNNKNTNRNFIKECETFNDNDIKFTIQNSATSIFDEFGYVFEEITGILIWVALGFAIFASLMLMSFITTSISYKKREIGILRALGARGKDVFGIFFKESLIIALINFLLAFTTTSICAFFINRAMLTELGFNIALLTVTFRQFGLILGISVLAAFIASIIPVSKISKKKPIDAINNR